MQASSHDAIEAANVLFLRQELRHLSGVDAQRYWALRPQGRDNATDRLLFEFRRAWRLLQLRQQSADKSAVIRQHYADLDEDIHAQDRAAGWHCGQHEVRNELRGHWTLCKGAFILCDCGAADAHCPTCEPIRKSLARIVTGPAPIKTVPT